MILLLKIALCSTTYTDDELLLANRAIGGESLDTSNFVLYIDENGSRFIEVPYEYMTEWIKDQKMWRTWSIMLIILCFIFFTIVVAFLVHNFQTSTGPFSLCHKHINENPSDDKMTSSELADYSQTDNIPMFNTIIDPRHISPFKNIGQL
ncbi:unnamed protein product [Adineta steineri]|uniref:Uncharacterized protein n=1 Tax=Adineta steineri TaxID=433720 RepID=A0A813RTR2_9BILA|nr:unnamed protein product [Adineta steineri]